MVEWYVFWRMIFQLSIIFIFCSLVVMVVFEAIKAWAQWRKETRDQHDSTR